MVGIITSVPSELGRALLAGIDHDLLADNSKIQQLMPQTLTPLPEALKLANHTSTNSLQGEIWGFDPSALRRWQPDYGYYPKQAGASFTTNASANSLWKVILRLGGPEGYFFLRMDYGEPESGLTRCLVDLFLYEENQNQNSYNWVTTLILGK